MHASKWHRSTADHVRAARREAAAALVAVNAARANVNVPSCTARAKLDAEARALGNEKLALEHSDKALATVYRLNARDECAHARFYEDVTRVYLEEDREGTIADLAFVAKRFRMPGVGLVPDYDQRIEVMRDEGKMDRDIFLKKVYFPLLKRLDVGRRELVAAAAAERRAARETEAAE